MYLFIIAEGWIFRMRILILDEEIEDQIRIEDIIFDISEELDIDICPISTGKISEFKYCVDRGNFFQLYLLEAKFSDNHKIGFQMADYIKRRNPYALIAFISHHTELALMSYKYKIGALDFIDKSVNDYIFKNRIKELIMYVNRRYIENSEAVDYFYYEYNGNKTSVPYNDIIFIETTGSSHKLRLVGKNHVKEFYGTLTDILKIQGVSKYLFSPHKSFIVNINNIVDFDSSKKELLMFEGHRIPISRLRVAALREILKKHDVQLRNSTLRHQIEKKDDF